MTEVPYRAFTRMATVPLDPDTDASLGRIHSVSQDVIERAKSARRNLISAPVA